ncbi:corrinoid protein [Proteinivorax tanatarense]|uniref:Corrinoid protein n=1 Tax=Proteinivorax tanatarense TaxID=1260629 RepID=A0AAU7VHL0_9FIRM
MLIEKKKLLANLSNAVVEMEEDLVKDLAQKYIDAGFDAYSGINSGLADGMEKAGKLYEEEEYYIPELLLCSDAMYMGLDVLKPHLKYDKDSTKQYKAVVGVVEGDTHDIGKNLFKIMLETAGFDVVDLGRDVPAVEFVRKAKEIKADLLGLSTLMTTTMENMKDVIDLLQKENLREEMVVMVGGGPISKSFADRIGADGYSSEASKGAKLALDLVGELRREEVQ